jgi:phosphoesterase RecJ-like protein
MFEEVIRELKKATSVAVFTHINPDGDALGSSIAFKLALEQIGLKVDLYCDDEIHENYFFLNTQAYYVAHEQKQYDLAVSLDAPNLSRLGKFASLFCSIKKQIVIDHHLGNSIKAGIKIVDEKAGSVGVLVYRLIKEMSLPLNKQIATALYTAISTDTGCFLFNNTTSEAHIITAKLMKYQIDLDEANHFLFHRKTKSQIQLLNKALSQLQFHENNKVVISIIKQSDFEQTNTTYEDTIGILNVIRGIDGVDISILLTETQKDCYNISLRSYYSNVSSIATEFQGGGHKHAAGCRICGKIENVMNKLLEVIKKELLV